jgi:hypothetical protein
MLPGMLLMLQRPRRSRVAPTVEVPILAQLRGFEKLVIMAIFSGVSRGNKARRAAILSTLADRFYLFLNKFLTCAGDKLAQNRLISVSYQQTPQTYPQTCLFFGDFLALNLRNLNILLQSFLVIHIYINSDFWFRFGFGFWWKMGGRIRHREQLNVHLVNAVPL